MRDRVRFVHTADLHLGAPFQGISAQDERVGRALADATYEAFRRVVDVCLEREADFLIISGDAYNSAEKGLRAQLRFRREMERLAEAGIEAFMVHGNHDPASGWSAGLALPETVHVFPTGRVERVEVVRDGEVIAAVYGRSFGVAAETTNFSAGYVRDASDPVAIAVLHANVGGNPDYDPYAPATLEDLRTRGMDYWALGHIHKQSVLSRDPWVVYPGSPQGLNPKETGPHGCLVVDITRGGGVAVPEHVETAPVAWAQREIDLSAAIDLEDVRREVVAACDGARTDATRPVVVRLTLAGRSAAHVDLARSGVLGELRDDIRAEQSDQEPWLWLDRLDDRTSRELDLDAVRSGPDFSAELVRISDDLATDGSALEALVAEIARPLAATLTGYTPGVGAADALERARDLALDLLLTEGGDAR